MVDAIGTARSDVGGGHAEVLDERREIGAAAEVADSDIVIDMSIAATGVLFDADLPMRHGVGLVLFPLLVNRAAFWAGDGFSDVANELLQRRHSGGVEVGTGDAHIGVEVRDRVNQLNSVVLNPLG